MPTLRSVFMKRLREIINGASRIAPYWGGAIYKMDRAMRKKLRDQLFGPEGWMNNYNQPYRYEDEGSFTLSLSKQVFMS